MLVEEDIDDDTHLCYKCSQTIVGLENYIRHRKTNCGQHHHPHHHHHHEHHKETSETISKSLAHQSISVDHPYGAFDFNVDTSVVDYHHVVDDHHHHHHHDKNLRNVDNTKSLTESYSYNYDLGGADVFFSSLQLQSISKDFNQHHQEHPGSTEKKIQTSRVLTRHATAALIANQEDWNYINADKFMKAVNDISGNKKVEEIWMEFHNNESSDSSESDDDEEEDYNAPPRSHTGGKWKPASPVNHSAQDNLVRWSSEFEPSTSGKWKSSVDEFTSVDTTDYTHALWLTPTYKPNEPIIDKIFTEQIWCNICNRKLASKLVYDRHIKTKYHLKRSQPENELEEASCPNAMEKLSKRFVKPSVYLNSEIYESDYKKPKRKLLDSNEDLDKLDDPVVDEVIKRKRRKIFIKCEICKTKLPTYLVGKHLISHYHYRRMIKDPEKSFQLILSNIDKIIQQSPFQCQICRFYANTAVMFMRHWKSSEHELNSKPKQNEKFWCSFCTFECDRNDQMTEHLMNMEHQETVLAINRSVPIIIRKKIILRCELCRKYFRYNIELRKHYELEHQTSVLTRTASDSYQSKFLCLHCNQNFQSRISLQKHEMKKHNLKRYFCQICAVVFDNPEQAVKHRSSTKHKIVVKQKKGDHEKLQKRCDVCNLVLDNLIILKEHLVKEHPEHKHSCTLCGETFLLSQEVSRHVRDKKCESKKKDSTNRDGNLEENFVITSSKYEIEKITSTVLNQSSELLLIPSVVSVDNCLYHDNGQKSHSPNMIPSWTCKLCEFHSDLQSDLIFHNILHSVKDLDKNAKISCPYCDKFFKKTALRLHLRQHTNERQFQCKICNVSFARNSSLKDHMRKIHCDGKVVITEIKDYETEKEIVENEKSFNCSICMKSFEKRISRDQHLHTHRNAIKTNRFKCDFKNCEYSGRSMAELKNHVLIHSKKKNFTCTYEGCEYKGKLKEYLLRHIRKIHKPAARSLACTQCEMTFKIAAHLKRHILTHTGEKPFKCPHCDHACNTIENLRKHVLNTVKHRGRSIFECNHCENQGNKFATNYIKEYKFHLLKDHNLNEKGKKFEFNTDVCD